jgi:hypothetical protein
MRRLAETFTTETQRTQRYDDDGRESGVLRESRRQSVLIANGRPPADASTP